MYEFPHHGGRLKQAALQYKIAESNWIDLSTGINPRGWQVPAIPATQWQRLPEDNDGLLTAAKNYYQCNSLLAVAGSQNAIQMLPAILNSEPQLRIGLLHPSFSEHYFAWQKTHHQLIQLDATSIDEVVSTLDVLVIVNPNNPTGFQFEPEQLMSWHQTLVKRDGWLIVDEAFIDARPQYSLSCYCPRHHLIVLRSLGKFFGLAGARLGFVLAENYVLNTLAAIQGSWPIATPSRWIATQALADRQWQYNTREYLQSQSIKLATLLADYGLKVTAGTELFQWIHIMSAQSLHQQLAQHAILTRLFNDPVSLRIGLPGSESQWQQLHQALSNIKCADHQIQHIAIL